MVTVSESPGQTDQMAGVAFRGEGRWGAQGEFGYLSLL